MNLLYTLTTFPPSTGGAQIHQHQLAQHLRKRHRIQVVSQWNCNRTDWLLGTTLRAPSTDYDYTIGDVAVHRLGLSPGEKLRITPYVPIYYPLMKVALPQIAACLERHISPFAAEADLIHNVRIGREGLSYASLQAARRCDIPFVFTPTHHPRWVGWRYQAYIRLYVLADLLFALTEAEKCTLTELGVPEERIAVTGIGPILADHAEPEQFLHEHHIDGPIVLFVGQHYEYKGYKQVLQAAPLVWQRIPEAHFVFIGPPVRSSEEHFRTLRDARIHRLGRVDLQVKTNALAAASILCVPSTQESFGGVYTEAWSVGKPVIACDIPAVSEVVGDGVDGYLVEQKPEQIAERISYLLLHPGEARTMGLAGQRKVQMRYTWERIADLVEQAYERVLQG